MSDSKQSLIKKPHQFILVALVKALLYGQPGIGKSTLALSAPKPLYIDCDRGVHRVSPRHQKDTIEAGTWEDCTAVLDLDLSDYETLVYDTAGKMLQLASEYVGRMNSKNKQSDGTLTQKGFGVRKELFKEFFRRVSELGKHIVFVAHDTEKNKGDNYIARPDVGGSSGNDLIRELDLVGYMEANGTARTISFDPTETHYGKNTCNLPSIVNLPDLNAPGAKNNLLTLFFETFQKNVVARQDMGTKYQQIVAEFGAKAEKVKDAKTANAVYKEINEYADHVWDSLIACKMLVVNKAKVLGLVANPATKLFEPPKKPVNTAETKTETPPATQGSEAGQETEEERLKKNANIA